MTGKDIRDLSEAELAKQLAVSRQELFGLRFRHATGELENTAGLRAAKRDVARFLTVARERGIVLPDRN